MIRVVVIANESGAHSKHDCRHVLVQVTADLSFIYMFRRCCAPAVGRAYRCRGATHDLV